MFVCVDLLGFHAHAVVTHGNEQLDWEYGRAKKVACPGKELKKERTREKSIPEIVGVTCSKDVSID